MKSIVLFFGAAVLLVPLQAQGQEVGWINRALNLNDDGTMRPGHAYCRADGRCYRVVRTNRRYEYRPYASSDTTYYQGQEYRRRYSDSGYRRSSEYSGRDRGTRVYGYTRRDAEDEVTFCRDSQRVVGDQHLTVDGAKKAANDAWAGTIRFHYGEKFMDLNNARRVNYTCSRSSIKEGSVTTLGQTLTRCEIEAQPCRAPRTSDEEK
jgi:hypothetical protein